MNRIMYDSVNLKGIPKSGAQLTACYLNGRNAVSSISEVQNMFPYTHIVPIDVIGDRPDARVYDVETGDISPEDCERIISDYNAHSPWFRSGGRPVIYCNRSTIPAVRQGTGRYALARDYYLWVAAPGSMYTGTGVVACQNIWERTYDSSDVFSDHWMPTW